MKNPFAQLLKKKAPTRDDLIAGMQREKQGYLATYNHLANYKGQQQKFAQGVMGMERLLLSFHDAAELPPEELLWTARVTSFQFLKGFLNQCDALGLFADVKPEDKHQALVVATDSVLDMLIEDPDRALGWLGDNTIDLPLDTELTDFPIAAI